MSLSVCHTILFLSAFSISSILYLNLSDYYFMPYLYIVLRSKLIFLIPVLTAALRFIFDAYFLLFPEHLFLSRLASAMFVLSLTSLFGIQISWYYLLWRRYRVNKTLNSEEKKESVYMLAMLFYVVACQLVTIIFGWSDSWTTTGESAVVGYIVVQIMCILLATVLPTRFMRRVVQMSEAILQLKREFVRYVSHEIRSPLNVVHAGLELLKADLTAADGVLSSTLTLLQDIYFASSAAIEILNDMLQYEHIDSGTFKLDCTVMPMLQAFVGRLDSFKFMLANKNITLHIEDQAQVSEFYSPPEDNISQDALLLSIPSTSTPPTTSLMLFMDRFRVQIIRNLMTNAAKFTPEGGDVTIRFLVGSEDLLLHHQLQHLGALSPESVAGFSADTLCATRSFLRIEVQDSGVGIAIEDQPAIFKQFAQFNRNTLQGGGGSGLGLWICKNLAAFHGGRMGFRSEGLGRGSTFFADLPVYSHKEAPSTSTILNQLDGRRNSYIPYPPFISIPSEEAAVKEDNHAVEVVDPKGDVVTPSMITRLTLPSSFLSAEVVGFSTAVHLPPAPTPLAAIKTAAALPVGGDDADGAVVDIIIINHKNPGAGQVDLAHGGGGNGNGHRHAKAD
eukprot:gene23757-32142_t